MRVREKSEGSGSTSSFKQFLCWFQCHLRAPATAHGEGQAFDELQDRIPILDIFEVLQEADDNIRGLGKSVLF